MKRLIAEARRLLPGVGIQVPPNLADWWPELIAAGATDLGGLSANGDHMRRIPVPEPASSPQAACRRRYGADRAPSVYPDYIDPEWVAQGVLDVVKSRYWSFIPRRGSGRTDPRGRCRPDLASAAIEKGSRAAG